MSDQQPTPTQRSMSLPIDMAFKIASDLQLHYAWELKSTYDAIEQMTPKVRKLADSGTDIEICIQIDQRYREQEFSRLCSEMQHAVDKIKISDCVFVRKKGTRYDIDCVKMTSVMRGNFMRIHESRRYPDIELTFVACVLTDANGEFVHATNMQKAPRY